MSFYEATETRMQTASRTFCWYILFNSRCEIVKFPDISAKRGSFTTPKCFLQVAKICKNPLFSAWPSSRSFRERYHRKITSCRKYQLSIIIRSSELDRCRITITVIIIVFIRVHLHCVINSIKFDTLSILYLFPHQMVGEKFRWRNTISDSSWYDEANQILLCTLTKNLVERSRYGHKSENADADCLDNFWVGLVCMTSVWSPRSTDSSGNDELRREIVNKCTWWHRFNVSFVFKLTLLLYSSVWWM